MAAALAVACAARAHGQPVPHTGVPGPIVPPRIEIGGGGGVSGTSPDVGMLASLPLGDWLSFDVGASYLARVWRSPAFGLGQAQLRIPFRRPPAIAVQPPGRRDLPRGPRSAPG